MVFTPHYIEAQRNTPPVHLCSAKSPSPLSVYLGFYAGFANGNGRGETCHRFHQGTLHRRRRPSEAVSTSYHLSLFLSISINGKNQNLICIFLMYLCRKSIRFTMLSGSEITKSGEVQVYRSDLYDTTRKPIEHGLLDPRMVRILFCLKFIVAPLLNSLQGQGVRSKCRLSQRKL